jgi:hypothetical protein
MPSTNVRFRRSGRTRQSPGHRKKKTAFAVSSVTFLAAMLSTTIAPSADARTVKKKTAKSTAPKTVPEDPKDRAQRLQFVEVVRLAALPHAIRVHATLGTPTCIGGVDLKPGRTFQCVVAFDASPIPFSVTVGEGNALVAAPTFPVVDTRTIATSVSASTCGSAPFAAVPTGSVLHCSISHGKKKAATTVSVRITGPDGTFTRIN